MHLQQTKVGSRKSGGPQYYFHAMPPYLKEFLRKRGACDVVLTTPYGISASPFKAVGGKHKIHGGRITQGSVGHERIQASGGISIGEAIRDWYGLDTGDFERIDLDEGEILNDQIVLTPTAAKLRGRARRIVLERFPSPLSFHRDHYSKLWKQHLDELQVTARADLQWAARQIARVVGEHRTHGAAGIHEADLLRSAGALSVLGLDLSAYLVDGYDCPSSVFAFGAFRRYECPVEIKKRSRDFKYQVRNYPALPRAVVLCLEHDYVNPPRHIDFIELPALAAYLEKP